MLNICRQATSLICQSYHGKIPHLPFLFIYPKNESSLWKDSLAGVGLALWRWKCFLKNKQGLWMQFFQESFRLVQFRPTTWECRQLGSNSSLILITPPKVPCPGWEQESSLKNSLLCQYVNCPLPVSGGRGIRERQVIMFMYTRSYIQSLPGSKYFLVLPVCWLDGLNFCTVLILLMQQARTGLLYHLRD